MSWGKLKNIIIGMLIVLNAILLGTLHWIQTDNTVLSPETVNHAVKVLNNHGITVEAPLIPTKNEAMGNLPMRMAVSSPDEAAVAFLGENFYHTKESGTGTDVYTKDGQTVRANGGYIKYYSGREPEGAADEAAWREAEETMQRSGISLDDARMETVGDQTRRYCQRYQGKDFFEGRLLVTADANGLVSVEGFWMVPNGSMYAAEEIQPVTEVFGQFLKDPNRKAESTQIVDIRLGYSVLLGGENVNYSEATAIPTWEITTNDGQHYYYSARR